MRRSRRTALLLAALGALALCTAVSAQAASPLSSFRLSEPVFSPNSDGIKDTETVTVVVTRPVTISLGIETADGSAVYHLCDSRGTPAGAYAFKWSGIDSSGRRASAGRYRAVLTVREGAASFVPKLYFALDVTKPLIIEPTATPKPFWPDGDGFKDRIRISASFSEPSFIGLQFLDSSNRVIKGYSTPGRTQRLAYLWSGDSRYGTVSYGVYSVRLKATDSGGNSNIATEDITVSPFPDISALPSEYRGAIIGLVRAGKLRPHGNGVFAGDKEGYFHPARNATRSDLAVALARLKSYDSSPAAAVTFSDVPETAFIYKYASLAVHKGYMKRYPDGTFRPAAAVTDADVLSALVKAEGLGQLAENINAGLPGEPWYAGCLIVAHQLGLKYRNSRTWPSGAFTRRELAWSAYKSLDIEQWRTDRLRKTFAAGRFSGFIRSRRQSDIIAYAARYIGYPYVWGGDSPSEGGFDCSGLMYWVYRVKFGYSVMRTAAGGAADSRYPKESFSRLLPGDLIYFWDDDRSRISHTGMYIGNGFFLHSSGSRCGTSVDIMDSVLGAYWRNQFAWGRRILPVLKVTSFRASPPTISPNGDGFADSFVASFTVTKAAKASLVISDGAGRVVFSKRSAPTVGSSSLAWPGNKLDGSAAASGPYRYRLGLVDEDGNRCSYSGDVRIDRIPPRLLSVSFSPTRFQHDSDKRMTVSFSLSEKAYLSARILDAQGAEVKVIASSALRNAGPGRVFWNGCDAAGTRVPAGSYLVLFSLKDVVLNPATVRRGFQVY